MCVKEREIVRERKTVRTQKTTERKVVDAVVTATGPEIQLRSGTVVSAGRRKAQALTAAG